MSYPNPLQIILWTWLVLALAAFAGAAAFVVAALNNPNDDDFPNALRILILDASIGFTSCAFALLGKFDTVIYSSRVMLLLTLLASLWFLAVEFRIDEPQRGSAAFRARRFAALVLPAVLSGFLLAMSFCIHTVQFPAPLKALSANPMTVPHITVTQLVMAVLGGSAIVFGLLFIRETHRTGPIGFETNPGGLGGNMGGWTISSSLTFLLATVLCVGLLLALISTPSSASVGSGNTSAGEVRKQPDSTAPPEKTTPSPVPAAVSPASPTPPSVATPTGSK